MNKTAIKNYAIWARNKLIADIEYKAGLLGVTDKGAASPLPQSRGDAEFFDIGTKYYTSVQGEDIHRRRAFIDAIQDKARDGNWASAFHFTVEKIAYTWFNRLAAIRFMEVNDYLPSHVRVLSSENANKAEPDMVTRPFDTDISFSQEEREYVLRLKDENKLDRLFRWLFIRQCRKLQSILPQLFAPMDDYMELLLTISFTDKDGVLWHLVHDIPEDDFNVEREGQVEIIGWLYQYYNTEPKEQVYADLKKNIKVSREKIPVATQLFTPDWIVRYMVENSLGRLWVEGHPNEDLKKNWKYYLEEAPQEPEVRAQLDEIRKGYAAIRPEDIRVIDPCMGSGHILVYLFDVLMQIYESQGWTRRDAARNIVENNLYGLDIDDRADQLAYFAVMMKARQFDRRFLERGIQPHVYSTTGFSEGEEFGSLLITDDPGDLPEEGQMTLDDKEQIIRHILAQKYDIVVTNPPYMGASNLGPKLADFVKNTYPASKTDLSTAFMEKTISLCKPSGFMAMINIPVWMFLSSFEKMRCHIVRENTICNMLHFGRGIFGSDFGTTAFVIKKRHIRHYTGSYRKLFETQGAVDHISKKERWLLEGKGQFYAKQEDYLSVPGTPIAYSMGSTLLKAFENNVFVSSVADVKQGLATGDNNRFLRFWYEVKHSKVCFHATSSKDAEKSGKKWFPYNKGGAYRKWYGNVEYVVNWENDGYEIKNIKDDKGKLRSRPQNLAYFFRESLTWSKVTIGGFSMRYVPAGALFDVAGCSVFPHRNLLEVLGNLNSCVQKYILSIFSQSVNYEVGHISSLPILHSQSNTDNISTLVNECVKLSKADWDSFETSWDFMIHPMAPVYADDSDYAYSIEAFYEGWKSRCQDRFDKLKANEEELNRIFIDIYGLQDELTPEVEDKDVTVRLADLGRDVRSLISYAVGCLFGRYSLDKPGLVYAGGDFDDYFKKEKNYLVDENGNRLTFGGIALTTGTSYRKIKRGDIWIDTSFEPDVDNCIPITDEPYFEDDIVGRFVEFIKVVYGERTLEENLQFIASALGGKGNSSRDVIRRYFLNDFYKDHVKVYQKRPIYWMFDAGKQNGFKALVYMHRWNADTVGNLRVEYLHKTQRVYEKEIERMQDTEANSKDSREVAQAAKRREKLVKQLKEVRDYDTRLTHIALSRVSIDLDDGVKVNYEKVQKGPDGKSLDILAKI